MWQIQILGWPAIFWLICTPKFLLCWGKLGVLYFHIRESSFVDPSEVSPLLISSVCCLNSSPHKKLRQVTDISFSQSRSRAWSWQKTYDNISTTHSGSPRCLCSSCKDPNFCNTVLTALLLAFWLHSFTTSRAYQWISDLSALFACDATKLEMNYDMVWIECVAHSPPGQTANVADFILFTLSLLRWCRGSDCEGAFLVSFRRWLYLLPFAPLKLVHQNNSIFWQKDQNDHPAACLDSKDASINATR